MACTQMVRLLPASSKKPVHSACFLEVQWKSMLPASISSCSCASCLRINSHTRRTDASIRLSASAGDGAELLLACMQSALDGSRGEQLEDDGEGVWLRSMEDGEDVSDEG